MPLVAPGPRRERILICGHSGTGKSTTWLNIAEWLHKTKSSSRVLVVDNDHAWEGARPVDGHLDGVVKAWEVEGWQQHRTAIREAKDAAGKDDWLVVDMTDALWTMSQDDYWQMAYGKEIDEIFLDSKINDFNMAGDYGSNWGAINKMYGALFDPVKRASSHVLCVTGAEEVRQATGKAAVMNDKPDVIKQFGKYGLKPTGQKKLPHAFHTILLTQDTPSGFTLTTLKERNPPDRVDREYLKNEKVGIGFVMQYLVKVAKWKLGG